MLRSCLVFLAVICLSAPASVLGELERRLGRFDAARGRFTKLPPGYAEAMATRGWKRQISGAM